MQILRVGSVPYLVARPLDSGLGEEPGIELTHDVPARLVERLRAGEIDVALVSSIELFRRPGYGYLAGPAVAGRGFVASVQLFLRRPLAEVRTVALDPASRTAATLARVLLADRPAGLPEFRELAAGEDPRAAGTDAWLRIGDAALREHLAPGAPPALNLSQAWTARTGLPFVFAAWIVRPGLDLGARAQAFARSRARGAQRVEALARQAALEWGLPPEPCLRYLREECLYELEPALAHRALLAFRDAAAPLGLCAADLEPLPQDAPLSHVP